MEGLGTKLRQLLGHLEGDVQAVYDAHGIMFKPRFYPLVQLLLRSAAPVTLVHMATQIGVTHSAISQTVREMREADLVVVEPGQDARERYIRLSDAGHRLAGELRPIWTAVIAAEDALDAALPMPLRQLLDEANRNLTTVPFRERILDALKAED